MRFRLLTLCSVKLRPSVYARGESIDLCTVDTTISNHQINAGVHRLLSVLCVRFSGFLPAVWEDRGGTAMNHGGAALSSVAHLSAQTSEEDDAQLSEVVERLELGERPAPPGGRFVSRPSVTQLCRNRGPNAFADHVMF